MFQQILLQIFQQLNHERTVSAAYHLLRGKRSGQTIQDAGLFRLHAFFGLLPKFPRATFDAEVATFRQYSWVDIQESGQYSMKKLGLQRAAQTRDFLFDGWHYRGNEQLFFARFSLVVQSLSYQRAGLRSFSPISKDPHVQAWVRTFLLDHSYQLGHLQQQLFDECEKIFTNIPLADAHKQLVLHRLSGHCMPGWTWQQLANERKENVLDSQLAFIEMLHTLLNEVYVSNAYPLLGEIAQGVRVNAMLTESAQQTIHLYEQGYSLAQIGQMRRLKQSTIEDHIVEFAMNEPNFSIGAFVSFEEAEKVWQVSKQLQTKKLKTLREAIEGMSYFQLRLILAKGEV